MARRAPGITRLHLVPLLVPTPIAVRMIAVRRYAPSTAGEASCRIAAMVRAKTRRDNAHTLPSAAPHGHNGAATLVKAPVHS